MISLKDAIKLTKLSDNQKCYIRKSGISKFEADYLTIKEIKERYNLKNTKVISIEPRSTGFGCCLDFEIQ